MQPEFMAEAIRLARTGMRRNAGGPFGAVVVRHGEIIARGWNRVTSGCDPTAHAEIVAIRRAARRLRQFQLQDCQLYSSCEPCPMCLAAIYWAGLPDVYYATTARDAAAAGFADDFLYAEFAKPPDRRTLHGHYRPSAAARLVFREWLAKADRMPY